MIIVADQGCCGSVGCLGLWSGWLERTDRLAVRYFLQEISRTESQKSLRERMLLVRLRDFQQRLQLWPALFLGKRFVPIGNFMRLYLNPGWFLLVREVEFCCWDVEVIVGGFVFAKEVRFMSMLTKSRFCYLFFSWDEAGLRTMFRVWMLGFRGAQIRVLSRLLLLVDLRYLSQGCMTAKVQYNNQFLNHQQKLLSS